MKTAFGYIRVSTERQEELSPDAQKRLLLEYAHKNDYIMTEDCFFYDLGISGKESENRPAFNEMIGHAKNRECDAILVWKFSRFARNQEESIVYKRLLRKNNVDVISISEPIPDGLIGGLIERIFEFMDEYYSVNLSGEVMRGETENALKGGYNSKPPYGYNFVKDGIPTVNEEQATVVRLIFDLYVNERLNPTDIARYLSDKGIRTRNNKPWEQRTILYLLENPFYKGYYRWNYMTHERKGTRKVKDESEWVVVDAGHEAIISEEIWDEAKRIRQSTIKRKGRGVASSKHWLSGMIKCSDCGSTLDFRNAHGTTKASFSCGGFKRGRCKDSHYVNAKKMEDEVMYHLKRMIDEKIDFNFKIIQDDRVELEKDYLQEELHSLDLKENRIKSAYLDGIDTIDEYKANKAMLQTAREKVLLKIENTKPKIEPIDKRKRLLFNMMNVWNVLINEEDYVKKGNALRDICEKIVYDKRADLLAFHFVLKV